jgi:hypothetical protein
VADESPIVRRPADDDGVVMAWRPLTCLLCSLALLVGAAPALADPGSGSSGSGSGSSGSGSGGDRDARVKGRCSKGASSELRLRARDGSIRVEFEVKRRKPRESWRVVFVHERRVAWRGTVRTTSSGSFRVRRSYGDYEGADNVTARATGPRGLTCQASATLRG